MDERRRAAARAADFILSQHPQRELNLAKLKNELATEFRLEGVLRNSEILAVIPENKREGWVLKLLKIRRTRTASGVSPVAVMTRSLCPHGVCLYCPRGEGAGQSYTGREPAAMRAAQNNYEAGAQVQARLRQYREIGHPTDKCELILMGGTFNARPAAEVRSFVKGCFDAFNEKKSRSLEEAMKLNEKARHRVVGVTFETRPDYAKEKHVELMLGCGATRVELGVQTLSDAVYKKVNRAHTVQDVVEATAICKDAGLKIVYHMMPGLFASPAEDVAMLRRIFEDENFKPDMLKLYPCLVLEGTGLHSLWKKGEYTPYDTETAARVIARASRYFPPWVRVMRVQRDIPSPLVVAGVKHSNLRQFVEQEAKRMGLKCNCIRCREIGLSAEKPQAMRLKKIEYEASGGKEFFLSFEDKNDLLAGFLRLRFPSKQGSQRPEINEHTALVRELHVYGEEIEIGELGKEKSRVAQHLGYGKKLLAEAEKIARKAGRKKLAVLSGIGVRPYYRALGYRLDGPYMSKKLAGTKAKQK